MLCLLDHSASRTGWLLCDPKVFTLSLARVTHHPTLLSTGRFPGREVQGIAGQLVPLWNRMGTFNKILI